MSESVKIDLRLDPGLKETLEDIAVKYFDARTHHKSGRPEITATINRLIKLGIKALEDGHPDTSASYPDGMELVITQKVNEAIANLGIHHYMTEIDLNQKLSPIVYDFKKTTEAIAAALAPIVEDVESLKKRLETLTALPSPSEPVELENLPLLSELALLSEPMEPSVETETVETAIAPTPSEDKPDFSQGLYGKQLAARLGMTNSGLSRAWKPDKDKPERPEYFKEWSREKDPDGLAWEKRNDEKFYPIG